MNEEKSIHTINYISFFMIIIAVLLYAVTEDAGFPEVYKWLAAIFVISFLLRPVLCLRTIKLPDGGFSMSFGLGTAITFLFAWFFSALKIIPFNTLTCVLGVLIPGIIFTAVSVVKEDTALFKWDRDTFDKFLFAFAVFSFIFFVAFYVKGFRPLIDHQTEQFMDFGFMQAIYRQEMVPPKDIWFAGDNLNYYYLGQACATFLCRVAFTTPEYGYNLMLCTVFAMLIMMVYSLVYGVLNTIKKMPLSGKITGGIIGTMMTCFAGNGHYLIYGLIIPTYEKITGRTISTSSYWFPNSTVYIGNDPDLPDKGKHEFPAYTTILGDLHAHICNMIFTLPLLILIFDYAASRMMDTSAAGKGKTKGGKSKAPYINILKELFSPYVILLGILTGLYRGVNYWDFPIYFVVSGAVILFSDLLKLRTYDESNSYVSDKIGMIMTIVFVLAKGAVILIIGTIVMIPFNLHFVKMASGIKLCQNHSQLYKLAILWGIPVLLSVLLIAFTIMKVKQEKRRITCVELSNVLITLCAIGLVLVPEIVYIRDIYGDEYARYNTMFKLTFQAFIIFGVCIGIFAGMLINNFKSELKAMRLFSRITLCVIAAASVLLSGYTVTAAKAWFFNFSGDGPRSGISSLDYLRENDTCFGAAEVIAADSDKIVNILEVAGVSYTDADKISAVTGTCAVCGWHTHEYLWRNETPDVDKRGDEIRQFYESGDVDYCRDFINRYNVKYIYEGPGEVESYEVNTSGYFGMTDMVWHDDTFTYYLYKVRK